MNDINNEIETAKNHIDEAYKELLSALAKENTQDCVEYKDEYVDTIHKVAAELLQLKRKL